MYSEGLLGIIAGFSLLAYLIYRRVDFGKAILAAVIVLLILSEPTAQGLSWIIEISLEYETLNLIAIIVQIVFLGFLYKDSGQVIRMIEELKSLFPDRRMVLSSIPAIFGLMPMPGGAYVSAPMIEDEAQALDLDGTEKTFLNWWWRHIWFWIYPLSMGLILAASISEINIYHIALFNLPIFSAHVMIGIFLGLWKIESKPLEKTEVDPLLLIYQLLPIIIALSLNVILQIPLYITLFIGILLLFFQNREGYSSKNLPGVLKKGFSLDILMAAYGIMLFKGIIERTEALEPVILTLEGELPLLLLVILASYGIGLLIGHLPTAVGVGFPIIMELLPVVNVRTVSMMFIFVLLGYFTSPLHLCIILTIEYFEIELKSFYRRIILPFSLLVAAVVLWLFVSGTFFFF